MPIPSYKEIVDLVKTGLTIEAQEKIMELRVAALEIQEENLKLRSKVSQLEAELSLTRDLHFEGTTGLYWRHVAPDRREGPFCARCYDTNGKLVRLHTGASRGTTVNWLCLVCHASF